jgi:hypothetical protein
MEAQHLHALTQKLQGRLVKNTSKGQMSSWIIAFQHQKEPKSA